MKRIVIVLVSLALFFTVNVLNTQNQASNNISGNLVKDNIKALTALADEEGLVEVGCLCQYEANEILCYPRESPECGPGLLGCN